MIPIFDKNNKNLKYSDQLQEIMNNLLAYPNVHTVYRSKKTTNGEATDTDCLVVHVSKKISIEDLEPNEIIPLIVGEGIPTDIVESEHPQMASSCYEAGSPSCYNDPKSFYGSLIGGVSFGVSGTCTLGAIVKDATDNTIVALSNNHCAGMLYDPSFGNYTNASTNTVGLLARQPSITDAGETTPTIFGSVKRAVPFKRNMTGPNAVIVNGPINTIDAVICSISISGSPDIGMLNIAENTPIMFVPSGETDSYIGSIVRKVGRTSCATSGIVVDTRASVISSAGGDNYTLFSNQVLIQSLPDKSPLSSIINDDETIYAIGTSTVVSSGTIDTSWNINYCKFNDNYADDNINAVFFDLSDKLISSPVLSYHTNGNNKFLHMRSRLGPDAFSNPYNNTNIYTSIFTSTDAINWNMVYYTENKYYGLIYANSIYFAIGNNRYMTSSDGLIWNEQNNNLIPVFDSQINAIAKTIAYGNNKFIGIYPGNSPASAFPGNSSIITYISDTDTLTVSSPFSGSVFRAGAITYGNNMFVLLPDRPNDKIQISNNGNTWTQISVPFGYWYSLAYGNGKFVAVRSNTVNSNSNQVMYSSDGINWTSIQPSTTIYSWLAIEYINNMFVASSAEGAIMTSVDGINWNFQRIPEISNKTYQMSGDSGSVTLTQDNKILCLNHSASPALNQCVYIAPALCYGSRMHEVAETLQIKPWQGEIVVQANSDAFINVNGRTYVRYGMTNDPITH